jgi:uncharacterized protein YegJ (DUF2314 family)
MKVTHAIFGGLAFAASAFGATPAAAQDDGIVQVAPDDAAVNAAIERARETLPYFWAALENSASNESDFSLKVSFAVPQGGAEHIWVSDVVRSGGEIQGFFANQPVDIPDAEIGQAVTFTEDRISDWGFMRDQRLVGHYTTRALLAQMPPEEAEFVRGLLGEAP